MTASAADLIAAFENEAGKARGVEDAYRREARDRIAALENERVTAFRRLNLVRAAANALEDHEEPAEAAQAARVAVRHTLAFEESGRQKEVLDRLMPFLTSLAGADLPEGDRATDPEASTAPDFEPAGHLRAFEDWYRTETGQDFYALFERYIPDTPRVDW